MQHWAHLSFRDSRIAISFLAFLSVASRLTQHAWQPWNPVRLQMSGASPVLHLQTPEEALSCRGPGAVKGPNVVRQRAAARRCCSPKESTRDQSWPARRTPKPCRAQVTHVKPSKRLVNPPFFLLSLRKKCSLNGTLSAPGPLRSRPRSVLAGRGGQIGRALVEET